MQRVNQLVYSLQRKIHEATNRRDVPELEELYAILNGIDQVRDLAFNIPQDDFGAGMGVLYDKGELLRRHENARKHIQSLIVQKTFGHVKVQSTNEIIDIT